MKRPLIFAAVIIGLVFAAAIAFRINDAPYIAFMEGRYADSMDGLREKADHGDSFAAFLVARNYEYGVLGASDPGLASDWYVKAATMGEIRSIAHYVNLSLKNANTEHCDKALAVLNATARSGDLGSLSLLGRFHQSGVCTEIDLAAAARYYMAAAQIDRQFNDTAEAIATQLDPVTAQGLEAMPANFDADAGVALSQFLAAIPFDTAKTDP